MAGKVINARVTFRSSPVHVLERFAFKEPKAALARFKEHSGLDECVIIQTCNRVELFASADHCDWGQNQEDLGVACRAWRGLLWGETLRWRRASRRTGTCCGSRPGWTRW